MDFKEIRPHFNIDLPRPIEEKYICISEFAIGSENEIMDESNRMENTC